MVQTRNLGGLDSCGVGVAKVERGKEGEGDHDKWIHVSFSINC